MITTVSYSHQKVSAFFSSGLLAQRSKLIRPQHGFGFSGTLTVSPGGSIPSVGATISNTIDLKIVGADAQSLQVSS